MNYKSKHNRLEVFLIIVIILILSSLVLNKKDKTNIEDKGISYIKESNVEKLVFQDSTIVLNKIDLDIRQESLLDIDNNGSIDINDLYLAKDIMNKKLKTSRNIDLNYDKKIDNLDSNLLKKYKSGVIDLDINNDNKENLEDINILELYINSYKPVGLLIPKGIDKSLIKLKIEDQNIVELNNGVVYAKKEGITRIKAIDKEGNTTYCKIIVIDYNNKNEYISSSKDTIYLKPTYLTTVEKANSDINKDNKIDVLDYEILLKIINHTFGDLNKDGITNNKDVNILKKYLNSDNDHNSEYDLNYDGYINNKDLDLLNRFLSPILIGDINKDTMVENRDIKIINQGNYSYYNLDSKAIGLASNKKIEYTSSDSNIVSVNNEGIINALKDGEVTINIKSKDNINKNIKIISNEDNNLPTGLHNDNDKVTLDVFDYKSNDLSMLDLNRDGIINNKDLRIYKTIKNLKADEKLLNGLLDTIINKKYNKNYDINNDNKVNLKDYDILYHFNYQKKELSEELFNKYLNNTIKLNAAVIPNNSINKVTYISKNSNIATVDEEGLIKGINKGKTEIIAYSVNNLKSITKVIVK